MKYFASKKIITDVTTISVRSDEKIIYYKSTDQLEYIGIDVPDAASFIDSQPAELEVTEMSYEEIKPILDNCNMMNELNKIIENQIADKYSVGREFKMRDLEPDNIERTEYENFKELVKAPIRLLKQEMGLIL